MSANTIIYHPIQNKYHRWYESICQSRQLLSRTKKVGNYYENHHIIPKKLGGNDTPENLVLLTAKEHFLVHRLLPKFLEGDERRRMLDALWFMTNRKKYFNGISYETIKQEYISRKISKETKIKMARAKIGKPGNRLGYKSSEKTKEKIRLWNIGRKHSTIHKQKISLSCKGINRESKSLDHRNKLRQSQLLRYQYWGA